MFICRDETVDAGPELTAIRDCSSDRNLRGSTERTPEDLERDIARFERAEQSSMSEFGLDVCRNVLWSDGS